MNERMLLLGFITVASSLDFFLYYFIANNLIGNKIKHALKSFTYKEGLLLVFLIVTMIVLDPEKDHFRLPFFDWIIPIIILLTITIIVVKNRNSSYTIDETILMFLMIHLLTFLAILPVVILSLVFSHMPLIIFVATMIASTVILLLIVDKMDLNKLLVYIIHRLALKISIFVVSLIASLLFFFIITIYDLHATQILIPSGVFAILIAVGLVYTLKVAHQYEIVVPEKYYNIKKILTLLNLKAEHVQTVDELKEIIGATIELMNIKVVKPETEKSENEPEDFEAFIKTTINSLKLNHQSTVEIKTNIQYFESHKSINTMNITYMLGVLLENALETGTPYPILVDVLSTEHILLIKVANETKPKTSQELNRMLVKGYSTKRKIGRGFGLSKLKSLVESHQGNLTISQEMNKEVEANYIAFTLNF